MIYKCTHLRFICASICISHTYQDKMPTRPGKNVYFSASKSEFPSSLTKFPSSKAYFSYVFLYFFSVKITKFPCKELPDLLIFSSPNANRIPTYNNQAEVLGKIMRYTTHRSITFCRLFTDNTIQIIL